MKLRRIFAATTFALLPLAASAGTFVIPAAGSGAGANGSHWQSELTVQNLSSRDVTAKLTYSNTTGAVSSVNVTFTARATRTFNDIVATTFNVASGTGAIVIDAADSDLHKLAVTSRTFNSSANGNFGQDIPAIDVAGASTTADTTVIAGPTSASAARLNGGLYATDDATVLWQLVNPDGTVAATASNDYTKGTQTQYNNMVSALFNTAAQNQQSIHAQLTKGTAIFYGSQIDQTTGDPTFVPGIAVREDIAINFVGIDLNEDGAIDVADADHDGVADHSIDVFTSTFPNFFKVVATGPLGEPATFELSGQPKSDTIVSPDGTVEMAPGGNLKGTSDTLFVRITSAGQTSVITIPVVYR